VFITEAAVATQWRYLVCSDHSNLHIDLPPLAGPETPHHSFVTNQ